MFNYGSPPKYSKFSTGGSNCQLNEFKKSTSASATTPTATGKGITTALSKATPSTTITSTCTASSPMQLMSGSGVGVGGGVAGALSTSRASSTLSLQSSNSSTNILLNTNATESYRQHSHHHYHQNHHSHGHHYTTASTQHQQHSFQQAQHHQHHHHHQNAHYSSSSNSSRTSLTPSMKRGKKNWGSRERSGMSFLIVIAFFAVFGLIILTEVFMIDERSHGGMLAMRQGSNLGGGRLGDSMPDYDNVKDDYDLLDDSILSDNKLGFVQFRDNKLKIQEAAAGDAGRYAGILLNGAGASGGLAGGSYGIGGGGNAMPLIPWGQVLPMKIEETLPHFPFGTQPTDGSWQVVNGTRFKFFVFSAYYDRRDGVRLVRIVGATKTRGPERVWCRFWYGQQTQQQQQHNSTNGNGQRVKYTSATVMARVKIIRENWNLKYSACFVLCPVRTPSLDVPQYVSVVSRLRAPPGNLLQLRNTDWDVDFTGNLSMLANTSGGGTMRHSTAAAHTPPTGDRIPDKIAVCVKPFHFNYDQALYLMEYLEFYALLGVSHFTFFNHTMGTHASCVLQHYVDGNVPGNLTAYDVESIMGAVETSQSHGTNNESVYAQQKLLKSPHYTRPTVTILPWNLRMRSQKEIRTEGLFAALNDCLYRTMYRYKYLALVDLDEFIVPRYTDTLNELLSSLNKRFRNHNTGAYSFQNAFFYLQFADDPLASSMNPEINEELARVRAALVTQRKTRRRFKLHPQKQRSKYICKPEAVIEAGNHFVWEYSPGMGSLNVPPKEAILQHYRVCEFGGNDCIKAPSIVDRTTTTYVNRLVQRVDAVYRHLRQPCDLPPLPVLQKSQIKMEASKTNMNSNKSKMNKNNNNEAKKLLQAKKQLKKEEEETKNNNIKEDVKTTKIAKSTLTTKRMETKTTPTTATASGTGVIATNNKNENSEPATSRMRKRRKLVVFEQNEYGIPVARVEYQ